MYPLKIKEKYDQSNLENLAHRFTTLYTGNYISGDLREGVGSHPGVDIVPEKENQDLMSILDGKVEKVGEDGAYGNYVIIKHTNALNPDNFKKKTILFSCYLHMSEVSVSAGDKLKEGDVIGKTGNTGMSTGEHLHFQIDREEAPYHSYWPYTGEDVKEAGITFIDGVNKALGLDNLKKYTVNPLVYLDEVEKYKKNNDDSESSSELYDDKKEKEVEKVEVVSSLDNDVVVSEKVDTVSLDVDLISVDTSLDIDTDINDSLISTNSSTLDLDFNEKSDSVNNDKKEEKKKEKIKEVNSSIDIISLDDDLVVGGPIETAALDTDVPLTLKIDFFKDVNSTDTYYEYLNYLGKNNLIKGYSNGTFRGDNNITRAEILKVIFNISKLEIISDNTDYFVDVLPTSWQKKYINSALKHGIISTKNKTFRPNAFISRVEALKMILLSIKADLTDGISCEFLDVNGTEWYAKYVNFSCKHSLIPYVGDKFHPTKNITRREVVGIFFHLDKNKAV